MAAPRMNWISVKNKPIPKYGPYICTDGFHVQLVHPGKFIAYSSFRPQQATHWAIIDLPNK